MIFINKEWSWSSQIKGKKITGSQIFINTIIVLTTFLVACSKITGKTCYECTVYRTDGSTYKKDVCSEDGNVPQFVDDRGNDLNSYCKRK